MARREDQWGGGQGGRVLPGGRGTAADADKTGCRDYYGRILKRLRPGGSIAIDADMSDEGPCAIREPSVFLHTDDRVDLGRVRIGDGLTPPRGNV